MGAEWSNTLNIRRYVHKSGVITHLITRIIGDKEYGWEGDELVEVIVSKDGKFRTKKLGNK